MGLPPPDEYSLQSFLDAHPEDRQWFPEEVLDSLSRNWGYVHTHYHLSEYIDTFVIRLFYGVKDEIIYYLEAALKTQRVTHRFNLSLSYILVHKYKPRYTVFYASGNTSLLDSMAFVNKISDIEKCLNKYLRPRDIEEEIMAERPSSKWKVHSILSMTVTIAKLGEPLT